MFFRVCKHCGKSFETDIWTKVFCREQCGHNAKNKRQRSNPSSSRWQRTKEVHERKVRRNKEFVYQDKILKGCSRCPEKRPNCLDYHHTDRTTKDTEISNLTRCGCSFERLKNEIEKCILLCRNCHAIEELGDGYRLGV